MIDGQPMGSLLGGSPTAMELTCPKVCWAPSLATFCQQLKIELLGWPFKSVNVVCCFNEDCYLILIFIYIVVYGGFIIL